MINLLLVKKMAIKSNKKNPITRDLFTKKYIDMVYNNDYIFSEIFVIFFQNIRYYYCIPFN